MKLSSSLKEILAMLLILMMVVFSVSLTSCSKSPDDPDSTDDTEMSADEESDDEESDDEEGDDEKSDDEDLADEEGEDEELADEEGEEMASDESAESSDELFADEGSSEEAPTDSALAQEESMPEEAAAAEPMSGDYGVYTVQRGDTLLKISFKVFQTYYKWKDLLSMNPDIQDPNVIEVGQQIKYPSEYKQRVVASVEDEYRIQRGDTLGTISERFYGTKEHWKALWKLNGTKVVNPNEIFYGTTINVTLDGVSKVDPNSAPQEEYVEEAAAEEEAVAEEPTEEEEVVEEEVVEEEPVEEEVIEE